MARARVYLDTPTVGTADTHTWPYGAAQPDPPADGTPATERMWDPDTGQLAYAPGQIVPADEMGRLVPESVWFRADGIRPPGLEYRDDDGPRERRRPGRPRLPRDENGQILR